MSGYESDPCGRSYTIRIRQVRTQIFLYPHKKICGYKNLWIRVDGALVSSYLYFHSASQSYPINFLQIARFDIFYVWFVFALLTAGNGNGTGVYAEILVS